MLQRVSCVNICRSSSLLQRSLFRRNYTLEKDVLLSDQREFLNMYNHPDIKQLMKDPQFVPKVIEKFLEMEAKLESLSPEELADVIHILAKLTRKSHQLREKIVGRHYEKERFVEKWQALAKDKLHFFTTEQLCRTINDLGRLGRCKKEWFDRWAEITTFKIGQANMSQLALAVFGVSLLKNTNRKEFMQHWYASALPLMSSANPTSITMLYYGFGEMGQIDDEFFQVLLTCAVEKMDEFNGITMLTIMRCLRALKKELPNEFKYKFFEVLRTHLFNYKMAVLLEVLEFASMFGLHSVIDTEFMREWIKEMKAKDEEKELNMPPIITKIDELKGSEEFQSLWFSATGTDPSILFALFEEKDLRRKLKDPKFLKEIKTVLQSKYDLDRLKEEELCGVIRSLNELNGAKIGEVKQLVLVWKEAVRHRVGEFSQTSFPLVLQALYELNVLDQEFLGQAMEMIFNQLDSYEKESILALFNVLVKINKNGNEISRKFLVSLSSKVDVSWLEDTVLSAIVSLPEVQQDSGQMDRLYRAWELKVLNGAERMVQEDTVVNTFRCVQDTTNKNVTAKLIQATKLNFDNISEQSIVLVARCMIKTKLPLDAELMQKVISRFQNMKKEGTLLETEYVKLQTLFFEIDCYNYENGSMMGDWMRLTSERERSWYIRNIARFMDYLTTVVCVGEESEQFLVHVGEVFKELSQRLNLLTHTQMTLLIKNYWKFSQHHPTALKDNVFFKLWTESFLQRLVRDKERANLTEVLTCLNYLNNLDQNEKVLVSCMSYLCASFAKMSDLDMVTLSALFAEHNIRKEEFVSSWITALTERTGMRYEDLIVICMNLSHNPLFLASLSPAFVESVIEKSKEENVESLHDLFGRYKLRGDLIEEAESTMKTLKNLIKQKKKLQSIEEVATRVMFENLIQELIPLSLNDLDPEHTIKLLVALSKVLYVINIVVKSNPTKEKRFEKLREYCVVVTTEWCNQINPSAYTNSQITAIFFQLSRIQMLDQKFCDLLYKIDAVSLDPISVLHIVTGASFIGQESKLFVDQSFLERVSERLTSLSVLKEFDTRTMVKLCRILIQLKVPVNSDNVFEHVQSVMHTCNVSSLFAVIDYARKIRRTYEEVYFKMIELAEQKVLEIENMEFCQALSLVGKLSLNFDENWKQSATDRSFSLKELTSMFKMLDENRGIRKRQVVEVLSNKVNSLGENEKREEAKKLKQLHDRVSFDKKAMHKQSFEARKFVESLKMESQWNVEEESLRESFEKLNQAVKGMLYNDLMQCLVAMVEVAHHPKMKREELISFYSCWTERGIEIMDACKATISSSVLKALAKFDVLEKNDKYLMKWIEFAEKKVSEFPYQTLASILESLDALRNVFYSESFISLLMSHIIEKMEEFSIQSLVQLQQAMLSYQNQKEYPLFIKNWVDCTKGRLDTCDSIFLCEIAKVDVNNIEFWDHWAHVVKRKLKQFTESEITLMINALIANDKLKIESENEQVTFEELSQLWETLDCIDDEVVGREFVEFIKEHMAIKMGAEYESSTSIIGLGLGNNVQNNCRKPEVYEKIVVFFQGVEEKLETEPEHRLLELIMAFSRISIYNANLKIDCASFIQSWCNAAVRKLEIMSGRSLSRSIFSLHVLGFKNPDFVKMWRNATFKGLKTLKNFDLLQVLRMYHFCSDVDEEFLKNWERFAIPKIQS